MHSQPSPHASDRPPSWRWTAAWVGTCVLLVLLIAGVVAGDRWLAARPELGRAISVFIAPYQELFLASLPGTDAAEYVVFLSSDADPAAVEEFFASQQQVRPLRDSSVAGLLIVSLAGEPADALELLRAQPFVRLTVRNQGVFFCH